MRLTIPAVSIREMREDDLSAVAEIEAAAFTDWYRSHRSGDSRLSRRTRNELRYAISFEPGGNFVAESSEEGILGFVLSRTWGSVGWFGTLAVPTSVQGSGIGRALVGKATAHLRERTDFVGLETMPESGTNIGLYARQGFVLSHPTVILELSLVRHAERFRGVAPADVSTLGLLEPRRRKGVLREIRAIGEAILPGLDYTREVVAIDSSKLGKTLLALSPNGVLEGFAVLRTAPFRELDASGRGYIHILAVRPDVDAREVLDTLLRHAWSAATTVGLGRLVTGVSARYVRALDLLLGSGFRAVRAAIRMVDRSSPPEIFSHSEAVNVSRWAG